jgi:hypothetical protein
MKKTKPSKSLHLDTRKLRELEPSSLVVVAGGIDASVYQWYVPKAPTTI